MIRFWWLKEIGAPGSIGFFGAALLIGLLFLAMSRTRRLGATLLVVLVGAYLFLSIPAIAGRLAGAAPAFDVRTAGTLGPVDHLFVLDGDNRAARAALAADLARSTGANTVWLLGYDEIRRAALAAGVPAARLRRGYSHGDTTEGQVTQMQRLMRRYKIPRAVAIVSRLQAERVAALIHRRGLNASVVACPADREPPLTGVARFVPSLSALALSRDALYERVAVTYYRWRGWISREAGATDEVAYHSPSMGHFLERVHAS